MRAAQALPEVLVGREDPNLIDVGGETRRAGCERIVRLELAHRPHRNAERANGILCRIELREKLRRHAFLGLVAVEQIVAEAANRIVERDRHVGDRLVRIVQQRQHGRCERNGGLLVRPVRRAMGRPFRKEGAEELISAVDEVHAHHAAVYQRPGGIRWVVQRSSAAARPPKAAVPKASQAT